VTEKTRRRRNPVDRVASWVARVDPKWFALTAGLVIGALLALGIVQRYFFPYWTHANLDSEGGAPKWVAAGLLWIAAGFWFLVATTGRSTTWKTWVWWPALAWLAYDEGNAVHERLESWSGIDWQLLYLPVIGIIGLAGLGVLIGHRSERAVPRLMLAGGIAWGIALLLELVQNWGGPPIDPAFYDPMMITEEIFEMIGSTLFAIAGLLVLRARRRTGSKARGR